MSNMLAQLTLRVFHKNNKARELTAKILGIDRKTLYRKLQEMPESI